MQTAQPSLIISIHDVSPQTRVQVEAMLGDLKECGAGTTSLLVIPDHHKRGRISQDPDFKSWIFKTVGEGHEAVVHGYYHKREKSGQESLGSRLITEKYTAGEGEFFDISKAEAENRLSMAREEFAACGLAARGFIAPAWLLGVEAEKAVRDAGFVYTTRIGVVRDYVQNIDYHSQSLVYSVRAGWRRTCSLAWCGVLFRQLAGNPLMRIGLHPPDWDHPAIRSQALKLIRAALAGRKAMTYEEWILSCR